MRTITFIAIFLVSALNTLAQQKPHYSQYIVNNYILNPAVTGIENYTDIKISYRHQWSGINGAPKTVYLSAHGPIGKSDFATSATSFQIPGENPRGKEYWREYTSPPAHHGIGGQLLSDITGYIARTNAYITYAYHRPLNPKTSISAGFLAGGSVINLDRNKIEWGNLDPNDPAIGVAQNELRKFKPEVGAGIWGYSANWFAGVSVQNIVPGKVAFSNDNKQFASYFEPHYFAQAGYRFFISDDVSILPSVCLQKISPTPVQLHVNAKAQYLDRLWLAGGYRFSDQLGGLTGMAGINLSNKLNIGYSYDVSTNSRLRTYARNTHEIVIGIILGNDYGDMCPRNVW